MSRKRGRSDGKETEAPADKKRALSHSIRRSSHICPDLFLLWISQILVSLIAIYYFQYILSITLTFTPIERVEKADEEMGEEVDLSREALVEDLRSRTSTALDALKLQLDNIKSTQTSLFDQYQGILEQMKGLERNIEENVSTVASKFLVEAERRNEGPFHLR